MFDQYEELTVNEKKIAIVLPSLGLHGGCVVANSYAKLLNKKKWSVHIVGTDDNKGISPHWEKGLNIIKMPYAVGKKTSLVTFFLFDSILIFRRIKREKCLKTLHIYTPLAFWFSLMSFFGLCKKPLFIVHDHPKMAWGIGLVSFIFFIPLIRFFIGDNNIFWVNRDLARHIPFGGAVEKHHELFNGLENAFLEQTISTSSVQEKKKNLICYIGAPTKNKGWDILEKTARKLYLYNPELKIQCFLSRRPQKEGKLPPNIELMPFASGHKNIASALKKATLLICCSRSESFCLPIIEGMSQGCGIITTSTIGSERLIREFGGGKLIDFKSEGSNIGVLIEQMAERVIIHPEEYYRRACRVRKLIWEQVGFFLDQELSKSFPDKI